VPLFGGEILEAPDTRVLWVLGHGDDRLRKVVQLLIVYVVGKEFGVVVQHDDVAADADAGRQFDLFGAGPTRGGLAARCLECVGVVKVFRAAIGAVDDRIAQADHRRPPLALADAAILRVVDALGERLGKEVAQ